MEKEKKMRLSQQEWLDLLDRIDNLIIIVQKTEAGYHILERLLEIRSIIMES
jgi:hypothetical protein